MTLRVTAHILVVGDVWLLKIGATSHQQEFEAVMIAGAPIELRCGARALAEIVEFLRLGRFEITAGGEAVHEEVVAQFAGLPAVVGIEVIVVHSSAAEVQVAMAGNIRARTRGDVEHTSETITVFRSESAGHQINCLEDLRTYTGTELGLCVIKKGDAIDELVQRKFSAAKSQEIIVAIAGAGHQVI